MIYFIYNFFVIPITLIFLYLASLFNKKLALSIKAREKLFEKLLKEKIRLNPYNKTILFHCSSMGEFKQALPVINRFLQDTGKYNIILSLFSPSAAENLREMPNLEIVTYLPFDTHFKMKKFIEICNPDLVIISKHDIWPNFVKILKKKNIPTVLINAIYKNDTKIGKWYVKFFFKRIYQNLTHIFTIDEEHKQRFLKIYPFPEKIYISGDSRFDIAACEANLFSKNKDLANFKRSDKIFVAGSSWIKGEKKIIKAWKTIKEKFSDAFLIIIPHEIAIEHIYEIEALCEENGLTSKVYSDLDESKTNNNYDILIVDKIGVLVKFYSLASLAYVGGGFGKAGLHSVIEPAAYKIPVFIGPNVDKSPEGSEMLNLDACLSFNNDQELAEKISDFWTNDKKYRKTQNQIHQYFSSKCGATNKIYDSLVPFLKDKVIVHHDITNEELEEMLKKQESKW